MASDPLLLVAEANMPVGEFDPANVGDLSPEVFGLRAGLATSAMWTSERDVRDAYGWLGGDSTDSCFVGG